MPNVPPTPSPVHPVLGALPTPPPAGQARLIERAYTVAAYWHRGQTRRNGDPYITHPLAVAAILAGLDMDHEVLCAALLHDVLDDTACPPAQIAAEFGSGVLALLNRLTLIDDPARRPDGWANATDARVLALKLADRLHNQRTLAFLPPAKQRVKSRESLEVFVPIARRLGMEGVGRELEELATATVLTLDRLGEDGGVPARARRGARDGAGMTFRALSLAATLLPAASRARWLEEWHADLHALPTRRARLRHTAHLIAAMPRISHTLRHPR
ncbi:HD domain-containing protein [Sphaerisporangium melleum]|nr:HD domain-containing protein [Sphaerisporangium melleum]